MKQHCYTVYFQLYLFLMQAGIPIMVCFNVRQHIYHDYPVPFIIITTVCGTKSWNLVEHTDSMMLPGSQKLLKIPGGLSPSVF